MRRPLRLAASVAVVAASLLGGIGGGVSRADEGDAQHARALDLFEKSEAAYDSGRFADAIALLKQSYALKREPVLLYNLGRAYEGLGDLGGAAEAYDAFLKAQPNAPDRGALERRIATLRRQLAEQEALRKQAMERDRSPPPRGASAIPWVVGGLGAAGVVGGAVVGVLANGRNDEAKREPTYERADRLHSQAESLATVSTVCFIAGGILVAGGVIWGIIDLSSAKGRSSAAAGVTSFALTF
jgi:tetratricopeptide (TPR) repeat protein